MTTKFNPFTGTLDYVSTSSISNPVYFSSNTYFIYDGINTVSLYINNSFVTSWTGGTIAGSPMGLLLSLTYA